MNTYSYPNFRLELSDPIVIAQGDTYDTLKWGPYQFPALTRTRQGFLRYTFNGPGTWDDINGYEGEAIPFGMVSEDNGGTWRPLTAADEPVGVRLANGHEYLPPKARNAFSTPWPDLYAPDAAHCGTDRNELPDLYEADRIPEYPRSPIAYDYDPVTDTTEAFPLTVNWPHYAIQVFTRGNGKLVYPMETIMGIMGMILPNPDGSLLFATYQNGFSAETGKAIFRYLVTVLRSDDNGRTWNYLSEIVTPQELDGKPVESEGFCEPYMERMADGSVIMLLRTGSGCPSYITRSEDSCKTWSTPEKFDSCGVFPQLLRLDCGVTLASYGRPGVFLRASDDVQGLRWEAPIDLGIGGEWRDGGRTWVGSCCYTALLALDETSALLAYSHFLYPNGDGVKVKTLLARIIRILPA